MSDDKGWRNRWKITGTLTTITPLHIGGDIPRPMDLYPMADKNKKVQKVDVTAVVTDDSKRAYIPGSTFKGNLRDWMTARYNDKLVEQIFGSDHEKKKDQFGGKAEFCDLFVSGAIPEFTENPPYWNKGRRTGVTSSVAIDRRTGSASDKKLFHQEFVPAGVSFQFCITGQDFDEQGTWGEEGFAAPEIVAILETLKNGFAQDNDDAIQIGAATANGWGRLSCRDIKVYRMGRKEVSAWLKNSGGAGHRIKMLEFLDWNVLLPKASTTTVTMGKKDTNLEISIKLTFYGPFLVNDKSHSKQVTGDDHQADMNPRCDTHGNVILPAESFRGAFRSQAERIIRTIGGRCTCPDVVKKEQVRNLCPVCLLFGTTGWRSILNVPQFVAGKPEFTQEFVAIDRFTGGAKEGAKFNAKSILSPVFNGTLQIDLSRLNRLDTQPKSLAASLGLLALTLRDLCEGDISFGFGSAKGYGWCTAVTSEIDFMSLASNGKINWRELSSRNNEEFIAECIKTLVSICTPAVTGTSEV